MRSSTHCLTHAHPSPQYHIRFLINSVLQVSFLAASADDDTSANFFAKDLHDTDLRRVLLGPSLFVYFNATFDDVDLAESALRGLHHLGVDGRGGPAWDHAAAIPPFGAGFGAGHLVSPTPIVTCESTSVIFDPSNRINKDATGRVQGESAVRVVCCFLILSPQAL